MKESKDKELTRIENRLDLQIRHFEKKITKKGEAEVN